MTDKTSASSIMRSGLGRARGLGSARSGSRHWWAQRLTALALLPLSLWFVLSAFALEGADRAAVGAWAGHPINATLLLLLVVMTFRHLVLGLQVVIEDYVHAEGARLATLLGVRALAALAATASVVAVLRLALVG